MIYRLSLCSLETVSTRVNIFSDYLDGGAYTLPFSAAAASKNFADKFSTYKIYSQFEALPYFVSVKRTAPYDTVFRLRTLEAPELLHPGQSP